MDRILTAKDLIERDGAPNLRAWMERAARRNNLPVPRFVRAGEDIAGEPVKARVDAGRWIADCACGGAEYVDPDDPIFFCFSCGNMAEGGLLRPVMFPKDRKRIEWLLLQRPVKLCGGKGILEQAMRALPEALPRSWMPGTKTRQILNANISAGLPGEEG